MVTINIYEIGGLLYIIIPQPDGLLVLTLQAVGKLYEGSARMTDGRDQLGSYILTIEKEIETRLCHLVREDDVGASLTLRYTLGSDREVSLSGALVPGSKSEYQMWILES